MNEKRHMIYDVKDSMIYSVTFVGYMIYKCKTFDDLWSWMRIASLDRYVDCFSLLSKLFVQTPRRVLHHWESVIGVAPIFPSFLLAFSFFSCFWKSQKMTTLWQWLDLSWEPFTIIGFIFKLSSVFCIDNEIL